MREVASLFPFAKIITPYERGRDFVSGKMVEVARGGILKTLGAHPGIWHSEEQLVSGVFASRLLERSSHDALLGLVHDGVVRESTLNVIAEDDQIFQVGTRVPITKSAHESERGRLMKDFSKLYGVDLDMNGLEDRLDYGGVHEEWEAHAYRGGIMPYANTPLYRRNG